MANPIAGETSLGDFTLAFNFGALCELEERSGRRTQDLLEAMTKGLSFSELRDFVWAGLQTNHRGISEQATLELLDQHGYEEAGRAVGKAISAFFGASEKAKGKGPRKAAA